MTRKRIADALPSIAIAIVAAGYLITSYDYDRASRTLPLLAGALAIALAGVDVATRRRAGAGSGAPRSPAREAAAFAWIAVFLPLVVALGFYASTLLYVFCYLRLYAKKSGLASAATAFGVTACLYLAFGVFMGYELFGGLLAGDPL